MDEKLKIAILNSVEWTFGVNDTAARWGRVRALLGALEEFEQSLFRDLQAQQQIGARGNLSVSS